MIDPLARLREHVRADSPDGLPGVVIERDELAALLDIAEAAQAYIDCDADKPGLQTADINPYSKRGRRERLTRALAAFSDARGV